ncbi:pyrroline-5-carboxylate reductase [Alkalihalobacillus sp. LMS39]|uniref:pyrroline-5-carboxylate reductase n=1 Tax=Alkalihalobacillus sp. LMS39 TaxID=2924032 RepID=UPI001FB387B1|nr:pyrroline-5-carboxylate reductase [Alkalihalobacillus sp. LMS39]UOE96026.1 pyrroline-5-carboxylate reductase [Alkalihalobacillus sp. LMS39]
MDKHKNIAFIGAGSMAESIIAGLLVNDVMKPKQISVINKSDKERLAYLSEQYGISPTINKATAVKEADILLLAMKPKHVTEAIEEIKAFTKEDQLIISVAAGISTTYISELLGHNAGVIRTMPNTSAKVGESATAMSPGLYATEKEMTDAILLFEAIGTVTVVPEHKLDAVTGLAGSGPAYLYYVIEAMEQAAAEIGLEKEEAHLLITQTLFGTAKRYKQTSKTAKQLYKEVMSPGGTTEAGLEILESHQFQEALVKCIARATERSKELGTIMSNVK